MTKTIDRVDQAAKTLREAPILERPITNDPKFLETMSIGDVAHQGDLTLVAIKELPKTHQPRGNRQLADGTSKGSRHVMARGDVYDCNANEVVALIKEATGRVVDANFIGPVVVSPVDPTDRDLTHPEHGPLGFPAGMICAVVHQRTIDKLNQIRRVID